MRHTTKTYRRIARRSRCTDAGRYAIELMERRTLLSGNMLAFTAAPTTTNAGSPIDSPTGIQVTVENSLGQPITTNTDSITLSLGSNPGGGTLAGTLTATAVNGTAVFANVSITPADNGYTLIATDGTDSTVTPSISTPFSVDAIPVFNSLVSMQAGVYGSGCNPQCALVRDGSGNLYGTTPHGGSYNWGTIFELSGTNYSVDTTLVSFTGNSGSYLGQAPTVLTIDGNGNLYGTTGGGTFGDGTVFELAADHTTFTSLVSFTGNSGSYPGANPNAGLTIDSSGNLYGTTFSGGTSGYGTVFEIAANHTTFTSLCSFTGNSGSYLGEYPYAGLTIDSSGNLYGTTAAGGTFTDGTVFEIAAIHTTFTSLVSFTGDSGSYLGYQPRAGLALDSSGNLYGTTEYGGTSSAGTVFKLAANRTTFTSLVSFTATTADPTAGGLTLDSSGNLFGTTQWGGTSACGTLFEVAANSNTFTSVVSFTGNSGNYPGNNPEAALTLDSSGNLYGTTYNGGTSGYGTVFELAADHTTFTSLVSFTGSSGSYPGLAPSAALTLDSSGNIYGTTEDGGALYGGTVFMIPSSNRNSLATLVSFGYGNGFNPQCALVRDGSGNLYGTTSSGGADNDGTIFQLSGTNYSINTTLVSFTGGGGSYPGAQPMAGLTLDSSGNLYGTTKYGGVGGPTYSGNNGTVFELAANHTTFTMLVSFRGGSGSYAGAYPYAALVLDGSGNLYGTTYESTSGYGTVFEVAANHTTFTSLFSFTGNSGNYPGARLLAPLTLDSSGNLYGTTAQGGASGGGTVFELAANHTTFTSLVSFTGNSGTYPGWYPYAAGLTLDSSGNLYGTTAGGGTFGDGTVFEIAANHTAFTSLVSFTGNSGSYPGQSPHGGLTLDSGGNLYGTTTGTSGDGTVFELAANHTTLTSLLSFTGNSGSCPGADAIGLILDSSGNLYGTTQAGGTFNAGTVFEIAVGGVSNLTENSGSLTIAPPLGVGTPSEYFSSVSVGENASIAMTPATSGHTVLITNSVSIAGPSGAWTGQLDLANNDLDITGDALSTVSNEIAQGYNGGNWTGAGITSSTAAADSSHLTALGVIQNNQSGAALYNANNPFNSTVPGAGDVLAKYTYYGDANLSGKVDGSDYSLIDNAYLYNKTHPSTPLTGWFNGDFNYDGVVNGSDYTLIDNAFNSQGASLAAQIAPAARATAKFNVAARPASLFSQVSAASFASNLNASFPAPSDGVAAQIFSPGPSDFQFQHKPSRRGGVESASVTP